MQQHKSRRTLRPGRLALDGKRNGLLGETPVQAKDRVIACKFVLRMKAVR